MKQVIALSLLLASVNAHAFLDTSKLNALGEFSCSQIEDEAKQKLCLEMIKEDEAPAKEVTQPKEPEKEKEGLKLW